MQTKYRTNEIERGVYVIWGPHNADGSPRRCIYPVFTRRAANGKCRRLNRRLYIKRQIQKIEEVIMQFKGEANG